MKFRCPLALFTTLVAAAAAGGVINSLADAEEFVKDLTPRAETLVVTGRVLSVNATEKLAQIILADSNGRRIELFRNPELERPSPGDTIESIGRAFMGKSLEYMFTAEDFKTLQKGPKPEPVTVKLSETSTRTHNLMTIRTEGTVVDTVVDEMDARYMIILLKDEGAVVPVSFRIEDFGDQSDLVDARVRVTGIYRGSVSGIRKFSSPSIQISRLEDLQVIQPPPKDPFAVPELERQLYLSTDDIIRMSKRRVQGEVLATWSGNRAMVRDANGRVVNLEFTKGQSLPSCGQYIIAAGQPETDLFRIHLNTVHWKPAEAPGGRTEESAVGAMTAFWNDPERSSINGDSHGRLVYAEGVIRILPNADDADLQFIIDTGSVQIPVDITSHPALLDGLAIDCRVRVTGRGLLLTGTWQPNNAFPQAKGFAIVVSSPDGITVLSRPSWWTPARFLVLIAILLLALAGLEAWYLVQRHLSKLKIIERTRLSVELHDTISQNLAGVACQVTAGKNAIAGNPEAAVQRINAAERMLQSCRTELRHCLFDLRSDMLEEKTFNAAILKALGPLADDAVIQIRFNARRSDFPDPAAHSILSIIRELTGNAVRHGHASNVRIAGCVDKGKLLFSVTDNGSGFDPQHCAGIAEGHFGLSGIRDRLKRLKGEIKFTSGKGKGIKATVTVPVLGK